MAESRFSRLFKWFRAMPRTHLFGFCAVLVTLLQAILALLEAPPWIRILALAVVATIALLSEADKWRTKRMEREAPTPKIGRPPKPLKKKANRREPAGTSHQTPKAASWSP
jgi:hypothetical protein